ncbi:MAG: hypothetical protein H0X13_14115 [Ramlibacter sp.]|nr:hypothetical protein [Ramlibacter sp.]
MPSVYDTLYRWARRTTTSFAELRFLPSERSPVEHPSDGLIYRLRHWPELPDSSRTADVYRALSMMSTQPINRHWIVSHSKLDGRQVDRLLQGLVDDGAVEVIDASKYRAGAH